MFKIIEGDFKNQEYGTENYLTNWPMLYILENGKEAYIGESNHVKTRMNQHHISVEKSIFDKVHFIYSKRFNQSVTFDYESKLIQYIVADEKFVVTNKNAGIADKEYFDKEKYEILKMCTGIHKLSTRFNMDRCQKDGTFYNEIIMKKN